MRSSSRPQPIARSSSSANSTLRVSWSGTRFSSPSCSGDGFLARPAGNDHLRGRRLHWRDLSPRLERSEWSDHVTVRRPPGSRPAQAASKPRCSNPGVPFGQEQLATIVLTELRERTMLTMTFLSTRREPGTGRCPTWNRAWPPASTGWTKSLPRPQPDRRTRHVSASVARVASISPALVRGRGNFAS